MMNLVTDRTGRRAFLAGAAATGAGLALPALAQAKPDKIVIAALMIKWRRTLEEEVGPLFEKQTGIKVEFAFLPMDALATRLKTQLNDGSIDVGQFNNVMANWAAPDMADHEKLAAEYAGADYRWDDILASSKNLFTIGGKLVGVPYRFITYIMHYRPDLLEQVGIGSAPKTIAEYQKAGIAITEKFGPERYGIGIYGKESEAMLRGWLPFMLSAGGRYYDLKTKEILINKKDAVDSLQYYGDLVHKYKLVPPEAFTWEWDGLTAGGQADRYAMTCAIASYGTALNDPAVSKTAGKWAWAKVPGETDAAQSLAGTGGWALGVSKGSKHPKWAFEFVKLATNVAMMKKSAFDGNSPPRTSVLNDPEVVAELKWAPAFAAQAENAIPWPAPNDPVFSACDQQLRPHVSRVLLGQKTAQQALDEAAAEWQRTFRRAGLR